MAKESKVESRESRAEVMSRKAALVGSDRIHAVDRANSPDESGHYKPAVSSGSGLSALDSQLFSDSRLSTLNSQPKKQRSAWRQRLVDAERGITQGFRLDSTFYGHFFVGSIVLATAVVLGISLIEWTVVVLALTLVLAAEMFNQALKAIWHTVGRRFTEPAQTVLRIGTAAVFVTILGAAIAIGLIFGQRLFGMLAG